MINSPKSVDLLLENSPEEFLKASEILAKFATNVLNNPSDPKFRKIRVANEKVQTHLLSVAGALECLFEMGFVEDDEHFSLPVGASLALVQNVKNDLVKHRERVLSSLANRTASQNLPKPSNLGASAAGPPTDIQMSELGFHQKVLSSFEHVMIYENAALQEKARACIPTSELKANAEAKLAELGLGQQSLRDLFLLELLAWYKNSFFRWMDAPSCSVCHGPMKAVGSAEPTAEELAYGGNRIENYFCDGCQRHTRFPRYNDPGKLLETRNGRCGEWANCFTLCCRASGFEARYVLDWTDHVWTEVYSEAQRRWLHCDPCENACDKPLLYEVGWGKKLTYVIAFSKDDVQDVTWRYTVDHAEVLRRRTECREEWLVKLMVTLRSRRLDRLTPNRRRVLVERAVVELVEMMAEKSVDSGGALSGRTTGSVEWRTARGETGGTHSRPTFKPNTITPKEAELECGVFELKYSCARDEYVRTSSNGDQVIKGWKTLAFDIIRIHRKEEHDWKKVYLAREENTDNGLLKWKIHLDTDGFCIDKVEAVVSSECFENGRVVWTVCGNDLCFPIVPGVPQTVDGLSGCAEVSLTAELSQGIGACAWQHTQLFRQNTTDRDVYPFHLRVYFRKTTT